MQPGEWRSLPEHDVAVGRHVPPASKNVPDFMRYFAERYDFAPLGNAGRILAMATSHHRFNYIHPLWVHTDSGRSRVASRADWKVAASTGA